MSSAIVYTEISAVAKRMAIEITATNEDGEKKSVKVEADDIQMLFDNSSQMYIDTLPDDETKLWEMFNMINGIRSN
jgi:hypothetical protein